jgi:hypothetical protein
MRRLTISLVLAATITLSGCGGKESVSYTDSEGKTQNIEVSESGGTTTVKSGDGMISATGNQGGANANFPAYAPQYPGATVQSSVDMDMGPGGSAMKMHVITQQTQDAPDAVTAFYAKAAGDAGKKVDKIDQGGNKMLMVGGTNPVDADAHIAITAVASGGTSISTSVMKR